MRAPFCILASIFLLSACDTERRSVQPSSRSDAILDGTTDSTDTAIVAVYRNAGADSELCSGYVIMPDLVLTARHCVAVLNSPSGGCTGASPTTVGDTDPPGNFAILTDTTVSSLVGKSVVAVSTPVDTLLCGNDLALLQLTAPLDGIVPLVPRLDGPPVVGEPLVVVGYGASAGGPDTTSGVRRTRADVSVEAVGASARTLDAEWIISQGPCAGDSGSPALDASGQALGVMSRGSKTTCQHMIYERLDPHADWLREQARASAVRLGVATPAWADDGSSTGGAGGASGAGGSAGGGGTGGSQTGGAGGAAGAAGASGNGGAAGSSAAAGSGGSSGTAGSSASNAAPSSDDGGCSMGVRSVSGSTPSIVALALIALLRGRRSTAAVVRLPAK